VPNWLKAIAITLVPAIVSLTLLEYFIKPAQSELSIADWGYRLTVSGFIVTLFGFAATIFQSLSAKSAAEAAKQSVASLRKQLGSFDMVGVIGSARAIVLDSYAHVSDQRWEASLNGFNRLRAHVSELVTAPDYLESSMAGEADDLRAKLVDSCSALSTALRNNGETLDILLLEQNLRDLEHFLILLSAKLKDRING
jgi:hypothetical protein